jgi:coenzyme F420 hydrogenase subunit beta
MRSEPKLVQLPLRRSGPLVESHRWPATPETDPPRALKSLARIIEEDLCHRCGSCVGICPTGVLALDADEYPRVQNLAACTDCDLCVKVCPGDEFQHDSLAQQLFGYIPDHEDTHGHFEASYLSYATDTSLRKAATSGGVVSALLIYLLEQKIIDGALVVGSDDDQKWKGKPFIARSREDVLLSLKSKYAISPTNVGYQEIREIPGKYAVVGLPCQIHGFHNAARLDRRLKERVILTVGLFCHAAVEHEPMQIIWEGLGETRKDVTRFISRIGKHLGTPHVELKDGTLRPVYYPNATGYRPSSMEIINFMYKLYSPARCLTCYDGSAEFADIAVGDPWLPAPNPDINYREGYSFLLARTTRGMATLRSAKRAGVIELQKLDPAVAKTSNALMTQEKRGRAFRIIETHRRQGKAVPRYGFAIPKLTGSHFVLTELDIFSHSLCFMKRTRRAVFTFLLFTPGGYRLLWVNHKRRGLRKLRRDLGARFLRFFRGASIIEESEDAVHDKPNSLP